MGQKQPQILAFVRAQADWSEPSNLFQLASQSQVYQPKMMPVLQIKALTLKSVPDFDLALFTSQNSAYVLKRRADLLSAFAGKQAVCVGARTANLIESLLGMEVKFVATSAKALEAWLVTQKGQGRVCYFRPEDTAYGFHHIKEKQNLSTNQDWQELVTHKTQPAILDEQLEYLVACARNCDQAPTLLIYSAKCAIQIETQLKEKITGKLGGNSLIFNTLCLSSQVAEPFRKSPIFRSFRIEITDQANEQGFARLLNRLFSTSLTVVGR